MKRILTNYKLLIAVVLLTINYSSLTAQNFQPKEGDDFASYHEFRGKVFINNAKAKDVTVKVFEGNKNSSSYTTKNNGKFYFTAGTEKYYTLQFEKEGYITKRIIIKTDNTKDLDKFTKPFYFDISLEKELANMDYSLHDFPMAIIEFNNRKKEFQPNKRYTEQRLAELSYTTTNYYANK